jgi:nucleotide-binding universal stress UspA family protein
MNQKKLENRANGGIMTMHKNERVIFERILFPTDLSSETTEGLEYAVALARSYGAKLFLCHCVSPGNAYGTSEDAKRLFGEMMAKHVHTGSTTIFDWEGIVVEGETATEVTLVAAEQRIDLIVMHSRRTPRAGTLLDSTAEAISRTAPCPVLITHKQVRDRADISTNGIGFQRILVAYDFSGDSELALTHGLSLAQEFQSELHLIHVLAPSPKAMPSEAAMVASYSENAFHSAAKRLYDAVPPETHLWSAVKQAVSQGLPYREILAYAEENNIDLICVGASGAGFGLWALFGSNADRILRQAACPVLIARPLRPVADRAGVAISCQAAS